MYRRPLLPQEKIGRGDVSSPDFFLREEGTSVHRLSLSKCLCFFNPTRVPARVSVTVKNNLVPELTMPRLIGVFNLETA